MRLRILVIMATLMSQLSLLIPASSAHAAGSGLLISGLQTASAASSSDEFVELYNPTASDISLTGWQLQYRAATSTNGTDCTKGWTIKLTLASGTITAGGHYLLASAGYLKPDVSFPAGLAPAGTIRLVGPDKLAADVLAWGTASCGVGSPAPAPIAGQSLERYAGEVGQHGDNSADFFVQSTPSPKSSSPLIAPVVTSPSPTPSVSPTPAPADPSAGMGAVGSGLRLTEILVDPVAPQTDAADEFIELYNGGAVAVPLEKYAIKSGNHTYVFPKTDIAAGGYIVVKASDSTLSFSNSGGVANLVDPSGSVIDTVGTWGTAVPGASWAFLDDTWRWTSTPTPGAANIFTAIPSADPTVPAADYAAVELSELLPNPASPQTDAADEFIELYNPTGQAVDLSGYAIRVGHDLASKFVIKDLSIPAEGYVALKSSDTKLALSNAGSSVALYAPDGTQLGLTVTYPKADPGNAWARLNGNWDWTAEPSPGAENIISPVPVMPVSTNAKTATPKSIKPAKGSVKAAATKTKAPAKTKTAKSKTAATKPLVADSTSTGGRWLLFILAGLTLAYIIYEFRHDLRSYYYKLRGYPGARPQPVPVPIGGTGDRAVQRPRRR